jgi:hypothetical protein
MKMDIWLKTFLFLGAGIAATLLMVVLITLSHAQNGVLSVDQFSGMGEQYASFFALLKWFVYAWLISAAVIAVRFIKGLFGR